jgi:hypothetical protein
MWADRYLTNTLQLEYGNNTELVCVRVETLTASVYTKNSNSFEELTIEVSLPKIDGTCKLMLSIATSSLTIVKDHDRCLTNTMSGIFYWLLLKSPYCKRMNSLLNKINIVTCNFWVWGVDPTCPYPRQIFTVTITMKQARSSETSAAE